MIRNQLLSYIRLAFMSASTTFVPWMVPLTYSAILWLQITGVSPHLILMLSVWWAIVGTCVLWLLHYYAADWVSTHIKRSKNREQENMSNTNDPETSWIKKKTKQLHEKLHIVDEPSVLFRLVAITTFTPIPDLVIIHYAQGKLSFPIFVLATAIGKTLNYVPIIYGIELWKILF